MRLTGRSRCGLARPLINRFRGKRTVKNGGQSHVENVFRLIALSTQPVLAGWRLLMQLTLCTRKSDARWLPHSDRLGGGWGGFVPSHSNNEIDCFLPFIRFLRVFRCRVSRKWLRLGREFGKKGWGWRGGISRKFDRKRVKILYHYIIFFFSSKKSRHFSWNNL